MPSTQTAAEADAGDPIEGAKGAIHNISKVKKMSEFADHLTNESAAAFSVPMSLMLTLVAGMGDAFANMGESLAKMGGQQNAPQSEKAKKDQEKIKRLNEDLKKFNQKYGLDTISPNAKPNDPKLKELTRNGRAMLKELGALMEQMGMGEEVKSAAPSEVPSADDLEYTVISPTEVKITARNTKDKEKLPDSARVKFEDGAWRLHFGSFEEVMQQMQKRGSGMGFPAGGGMGAPMGGAMPGGNSTLAPGATR